MSSLRLTKEKRELVSIQSGLSKKFKGSQKIQGNARPNQAKLDHTASRQISSGEKVPLKTFVNATPIRILIFKLLTTRAEKCFD